MSDVLNGSKKSADTNKKQTEVVPTQDSNGTDNQCQIVEHHSPSELLAGMCTPIFIFDIDLIFQVHVHSMILVCPFMCCSHNFP